MFPNFGQGPLPDLYLQQQHQFRRRHFQWILYGPGCYVQVSRVMWTPFGCLVNRWRLLKPKERKKGGNDELQVLSALTFFPRTSSPLDAKPLPRKMICVGVGDNRGRGFFPCHERCEIAARSWRHGLNCRLWKLWRQELSWRAILIHFQENATINNYYYKKNICFG